VKKTKNKFEATILKALKKNRKIKVSYETEKIPYLIAGHYIPDFILTGPKGKIYIETKGHFRPEAKRKMVAVKKLNPQLDIRIVFYSFSRSYARWAERYKFPYAVGDVPKEWIQELL
jgi:predicted nuclease of restriction endonuclease-like RecB superfamily